MSKKLARENIAITKFIYLFLGLILFVFSASQIGFVPERFSESAVRASYMFHSMLPPTLSRPPDIVAGAIESIQVAVLGTFFGIIFSLVLSIFAAKNLTPHIFISHIVKAFATLVRAVPAMIWALLFIIAVGLGTTPGIMALSVNSIGMLVKVYSAAIEEIDDGVIEAIKATGGSKVHVVLQGVMPSIMSIFISWSILRFDSNIRYSTVLGIVGAGGIGWELLRASRNADYGQVLGVTFVIFIIVLSMEYFSRFLRSRIDSSTMEVQVGSRKVNSKSR